MYPLKHQNVYVQETKFTSHKQYLFTLLFSINAKTIHTHQIIQQDFFLLLQVFLNVSKTFKSGSCNFLQVCMLLVQLASINYFYSM